MNIQLLKRDISHQLCYRYPDSESDAIARRLLEELTGRSYSSMIMDGYKLTQNELLNLDVWLSQLITEGQPLQYVVGRAYFGGSLLRVGPGVLIPRPETEELCQILLERGIVGRCLHAADIGTGSGAIAIFLALGQPLLHVDAIEVSPDAIEIAQYNIDAHHLGDRVQIRMMDVLHPIPEDIAALTAEHPYDLIISNPPYIPIREAADMDSHVVDHEPRLALFVPDDDPLLYYRRILQYYVPHMVDGGCLALELHHETAKACHALCQSAGLDAELLTDLSGRPRFVIATKRDHQ